MVAAAVSGSPNALGFYQMNTTGHCMSNGKHPATLQAPNLVNDAGGLLNFDAAAEVAGALCARLTSCTSFDVNNYSGYDNSPNLYASNGQAMLEELQGMACNGEHGATGQPWIEFTNCGLPATQSGVWRFYDSRTSGNRCAVGDDCPITETQTYAHPTNVCFVKGECEACDNYPEASSPSHVDTYYKGADTPFDFAELNTPPGATFEDKLQACKDKCDTDSWSDPNRFTGKCVGVGYAADANHAGLSFCYGVMDPPYHQDAAMEGSPNWVLLMKDNC